MTVATLQLANVCRAFGSGETQVRVLEGADFALMPGEMVALVGPSGAGKSTLLHIAGLLEHADKGEVFLGQTATAALDDEARTRMRRHEIGFVYQFHHLMGEFSAIENVVLPQRIAGLSVEEAAKRARDVLGFLGLGHRLEHRPGELSGGEQQRVAIARAVANSPSLLLADEPTGNLDPTTGEHVFTTLQSLVKQSGLAALIATHNLDLARRMDRRVTLKEGRVVDI
ncbi:MAG: ABC transporter ATP-binding protein [Rhabdaerophilum sp.]